MPDRDDKHPSEPGREHRTESGPTDPPTKRDAPRRETVRLERHYEQLIQQAKAAIVGR